MDAEVTCPEPGVVARLESLVVDAVPQRTLATTFGFIAAGGSAGALLGPIAWRTPPEHYGPWELFASLLTEGLVDRGHDVTLFASGDSVTRAPLIRSGSAPPMVTSRH